MAGSLIYLYLPLIPDIALMRDKLGAGASAFKRKVYTLLAVGWQNTPKQRERLEKAIWIMAVTIIPVMVTVHTVVSFVFSMTLRPGWDSTIFGIYFVMGALFSGLATVLVIMAIFRKIFHLEEYLTERHFRNLSYLLLVALFFYVYLTLSEYITLGYKMAHEHQHLLEILILGKSAVWFWFFWIAGIIVPAFLLLNKKLPTIPRIIAAAALINVAMWVKRFIILIPSLEVPLMPFEFGSYSPSWVEWSITAGAFALFILLYTLSTKFVPIISVWEMTEVKDIPPENKALTQSKEEPKKA